VQGGHRPAADHVGTAAPAVQRSEAPQFQHRQEPSAKSRRAALDQTAAAAVSMWVVVIPVRLREQSTLVEPFNQVEVGKGSVEAVDKRLSVGSYQNWTDGRHAGWIPRNELFPEGSFSGS